jgi:glycosyltransferase involved in cell wall biosynthesis
MQNQSDRDIVPDISVIIPAYNQAHYLLEAIESLIQQTYPDFEAVIVNDGSTDETESVLAGIQDRRFRIITQPNAGLSAARNTGIKHSSAPFVSLLDADDFFLPEKLALLGLYLKDHPEIGMVSGGTLFVDQNSQTFREVVKSPAEIQLPGLLMGNPFNPSSVMMRRYWFERVGFFDEKLRACEDWDLWLRMASAGCQFGWVEQPVAAYRFHRGQMTRDSSRMRSAILAVHENFFNQPGLPESLTKYKNSAAAAARVHAAAYEYNAKEFKKGQSDLFEAVSLDQTLNENHYEKLIGLLKAWALDPRSSNSVDFFQLIIDNPPSGLAGFIRQLQRAQADMILAPLFSSSKENLRAHRRDLLTVIRKKPEWMLNRGVLKMILVAWGH